MELLKIICESLDWTELAQDSIQWQDFLMTALTLRVP
jgi:hypothetical protein